MQVITEQYEFQPVTLVIDSPEELADLVGALGAYGKGVSKALKTIREAGLEDDYSGNARKTARAIVRQLADEVGFAVPDFSATDRFDQ